MVPDCAGAWVASHRLDAPTGFRGCFARRRLLVVGIRAPRVSAANDDESESLGRSSSALRGLGRGDFRSPNTSGNRSHL